MYSRSDFDNHYSSFCTFVVPIKIWLSNSSILDICGLIPKQLSFSFLESSNILIDLSICSVINIGDAKKSSSTFVLALSVCLELGFFSFLT